jgi:ABC-type Zn2+ transport system substrate-binding protein/surface adhesin
MNRVKDINRCTYILDDVELLLKFIDFFLKTIAENAAFKLYDIKNGFVENQDEDEDEDDGHQNHDEDEDEDENQGEYRENQDTIK